MKNTFLMATIFLTFSLGVFAPSLFAKPVHLPIKKAQQKSQEKAAKAQIKNIDLQNIEDPEARKAIREIFNYLNLSAKN